MSLIHHENLNFPYIIQKFSESISRIDPNNFSILKPEKKQDIRRLFEHIKDKIIIENSKIDKAVVSILPHYIKELKKNKGFSSILDFIEDSRKNELNIDLSKYIKNAQILSMMQRLYEQVNRLYDNPHSKHIRGGAMTDIFNIKDSKQYNYYTIIEVVIPDPRYETLTQKIHIYFKISIEDSKGNIKSIYKNKENRVKAIEDNIIKFYKFVEDLLKINLITVTDFENLDLNNLLIDINAMRDVEQLNSDAVLPILPERIPDIVGESVVGKLTRIKNLLMTNIKQILELNIEEIELHGNIYFFNINDEKEFLNAYGPLKAVLKYNYNTGQVIDLKTVGVNCSDVIKAMRSNDFDAENFFIELKRSFHKQTFPGETDIIGSFRSEYSEFLDNLWGAPQIDPEQINFVIVDTNVLFVFSGDKIHDTFKNSKEFILFDPTKSRFQYKNVWYTNLTSKSLSYIGDILNNDANDISLSTFLNSSLAKLEGNSKTFEVENKQKIQLIKEKRNILAVAKKELDEKIKEKSKIRGLLVFCVFLLTNAFLVLYWFMEIATLPQKGLIIAASAILIYIVSICKEALSPIFVWIMELLANFYDLLRRIPGLNKLPSFGDNFTDIKDVENKLETAIQQLKEGDLTEDKLEDILATTEFGTLKKALTGGSTRFTRKSKNKLKKTKKAIFNKQNKTIKKNKITGGMNNNKYLLNEIIYACISFLELIFFPEDHNMITLDEYLTMTISIIGNIKCVESDLTHHKKGKSRKAFE